MTSLAREAPRRNVALPRQLSIPQRTLTRRLIKASLDLAEYNNPRTSVSWERATQSGNRLGIDRSACFAALASLEAPKGTPRSPRCRSSPRYGEYAHNTTARFEELQALVADLNMQPV
jgi:hypothetical protein